SNAAGEILVTVLQVENGVCTTIKFCVYFSLKAQGWPTTSCLNADAGGHIADIIPASPATADTDAVNKPAATIIFKLFIKLIPIFISIRNSAYCHIPTLREY